MPKKILLAEKSDAIRGIAESILHQHGYDAISASSTEKAKELIIASQPNMVVVGADLIDSDGRYLYDLLEENPATAGIPVLLIADPNGRSLSYPDEVILPRPFDPNDFIDRVRLFVGGGAANPVKEKVETINPFISGSIDDEFLDAALGIDHIDVESSEDMDKSFMTGKLKIPQPGEQPDGFEIHQPQYDDTAKKVENQKVESLMIREDGMPNQPEKAKPRDLSASSKIEIANDQYGLINPDAHEELESKHSPHDYDWFIKEMQKEASNLIEPGSPESEIKIKAPSDSVEPIKAPSSPAETTDGIRDSEKPIIKPGGVDQFIDEFKKEMAALTAPVLGSSGKSAPDTATPPEYKESETAIKAAEIRHFSNYLAELLAERLAKEIADKIDVEEIYKIVKDDLSALLAEKNRLLA
jgi:DNA-binding response OmpR family regulator